jgi:hypothetical protein
MDPYLRLTDPAPDPALFVLLFEGTFISFFKDTKSQNSINQGISYYFCLKIEGSGPGRPKT